MRTELTAEMWSFPTAQTEHLDIVGFDVETADGSIGRIAGASFDAGSSYVIVDTGPWILGREVLVPAGLVDRIDLETGSIRLSLTKEHLENSPEFDADAEADGADAYRERLGTYYADHFASLPRGKMVRVWFTSGLSGRGWD